MYNQEKRWKITQQYIKVTALNALDYLDKEYDTKTLKRYTALIERVYMKQETQYSLGTIADAVCAIDLDEAESMSTWNLIEKVMGNIND